MGLHYTIQYIGDYHDPLWEILLNNQCNGGTQGLEHCLVGTNPQTYHKWVVKLIPKWHRVCIYCYFASPFAKVNYCDLDSQQK